MQTQREVPGITRVADQVLEDAAKDRVAITLANMLLNEGYHILAIEVVRNFEPVVWVSVDVRLASQVAHDENSGCYYKHGCDGLGIYRTGQIKRNGAIVRWMERPGRTEWWRH